MKTSFRDKPVSERADHESGSAHPYGRTLRRVLITDHGVPSGEVVWFIYCQLFPLRTRFWRNVRLLLGGDPYDPEFALSAQLLNAVTVADVDRALHSYPARRNRLVILALGCSVDRERVLRFFHDVLGVTRSEAESVHGHTQCDAA